MINRQKLCSIRLADNIALVAQSLEEMLNTLSNIHDEYHLKINAQKTKTMTNGESHYMAMKLGLQDKKKRLETSEM